jgi:serine/threonine-protein kinase RsbT
MTAPSVDIRIADEADVVAARVTGGRLARSAGFGEAAAHCIVISISELAGNILAHAGNGTIRLRIIRVDGKKGLEVVARDTGKGIEDVEAALTDGFSTGGGLGSGLPGAQRMMSELHVASDVEGGAVVRAVKWLEEERLP